MPQASSRRMSAPVLPAAEAPVRRVSSRLAALAAAGEPAAPPATAAGRPPAAPQRRASMAPAPSRRMSMLPPCPAPRAAPAMKRVRDEERSRVQVVVRVRPLSAAEAGQPAVVEVSSDGTEVSLHEPCAADDYLGQLRRRSRRWRYDAALGPAATSAAVYAASAAPLVADVAAGAGNATVFCYGATGAGKTHTMLGTAAQPGVMVLAIAELFERLGSEPGAEVKLAYLEIYNENVRDLFAAAGVSAPATSAGGVKPSLELREDPLAGVVVTGLTYVAAASASEVLALLTRGNGQRVTEPTRANATSSRSHAVLQVFVRRACFAHTSKLSLIDLAGSERALATDARTARSAEGAAINKSLLALATCINALVQGQRHIPYRNSRLTQLLKDSLGGGCRTAMIANVSPAESSFSESGNTLHWADRAKEIRTVSAEEREARDEAAAAAAAEAAAQAEAAAAAAADAEAQQAAQQAQNDNAALIASLQSENEALRRRVAAASAADAAAAAPAAPMRTDAPTPHGFAACFANVTASEDAAAAAGRARTRRRVGDALFSPTQSRPPFLTASAPNGLAIAAASPRPTPGRRGATRAMLAEEAEALRLECGDWAERAAAAEARAAELEAAVEAAAAAAERDRAEWLAERAAAAAAAEAARSDREALQRQLSRAHAEAQAARAAAAAATAAQHAAHAAAAAAAEAQNAAPLAMQTVASFPSQPLPLPANPLATAPSLGALLSPAGARLRAARRASLTASAALAASPRGGMGTTLADVTNSDTLMLAAEAADDVAPLSAVKAAVRSFEAAAAVAGTPGGAAAARPLPPSPGRIMSTRLYQRFSEAAAAHAQGAMAAATSPLVRTGSGMR